jgi:hypothetical protein
MHGGRFIGEVEMSGTKDLPRGEKGRFAPRGGGEKEAPAKRRGKGAKAKPAIKWTVEKGAVFFRELAMVCNVRAALRKAKLTGCGSLAYERRKTDSRFRAAWEAAIDQSYAMLELEMLERSRFGDDRPPPATEAERRLRAVPTALALQLLRLYENRVKARASAPARAPAAAARRPRGDDLRKQLEQMLYDLHRRMGGKS